MNSFIIHKAFIDTSDSIYFLYWVIEDILEDNYFKLNTSIIIQMNIIQNDCEYLFIPPIIVHELLTYSQFEKIVRKLIPSIKYPAA